MSSNSDLFKQAKQHIPGGVNSPVRAFKSVGGDPVFIQRAKGAYVYDENDKRYIDYVASYGPMILGHSDDEVAGRDSTHRSQGAKLRCANGHRNRNG